MYLRSGRTVKQNTEKKNMADQFKVDVAPIEEPEEETLTLAEIYKFLKESQEEIRQYHQDLKQTLIQKMDENIETIKRGVTAIMSQKMDEVRTEIRETMEEKDLQKERKKVETKLVENRKEIENSPDGGLQDEKALPNSELAFEFNNQDENENEEIVQELNAETEKIRENVEGDVESTCTDEKESLTYNDEKQETHQIDCLEARYDYFKKWEISEKRPLNLVQVQLDVQIQLCAQSVQHKWSKVNNFKNDFIKVYYETFNHYELEKCAALRSKPIYLPSMTRKVKMKLQFLI